MGLKIPVSVIPVADHSRRTRFGEVIPGPIFLWEVVLGKSKWYLYKKIPPHYYFPYPSVQMGTKVYQFGKYYFWKGTYKY